MAAPSARSVLERLLGGACVVVQIATVIVWACVLARVTEAVGSKASSAGVARATPHPRRPP